MPASGGKRPAQRKIAQMREQERARQRRFRILGGAGLVAVLAVIAVVVVLISGNQAKTVTASTRGMASGATVDGISCDSTEQVAYHIHAHLAIYVNGKARTVPRGIGIPAPEQVQNNFVVGGKCFYWLHTHDSSGIIHIESPTQRVYTLGQFFDIWGQPLSTSQVDGASGHVTVFVNGHTRTGNPRTIKLTPQEVIQLDVGPVTPFHAYRFPPGL